MQIRFRCDLCNQPLRTKEELSGKKIRCPKCQALLLVPAPPQKPKEMEGALEITIEEGELIGKARPKGPPVKPAAPPAKSQVPPKAPPRVEAEPPQPAPPAEVPKVEAAPPSEAGEIIPFLDEKPTETIAQEMAREAGVEGPSLKPLPTKGKGIPSRAVPLKPEAEPAPSARRCPRCKKVYPQSAKICVNCGIYIDDGLPIGLAKKKLAGAPHEKGLPEKVGLWKLVWLIITHPFRAMEGLIGYASTTDMLAKMVGFYFLSLGLFFLPGLPAVGETEIELGALPAFIAIGIVLILFNVIVALFWALGINFWGRLFGSIAGGTFLAILVALIFIKGITGISLLVVFLAAKTGLVGGAELSTLMLTLTTVWPLFLYTLAARNIYDVGYATAFIVVIFGLILGGILLAFTSCVGVALGISALSLFAK